MDTVFKSPMNDNICHSTPNILAGSLDSAIRQSFPHTALSFQLGPPIITSHPTTPSLLPSTSSINRSNFQSADTGTTPRSENTGVLRKIPGEWYGEPYLETHLLISFLHLSKLITKNS